MPRVLPALFLSSLLIAAPACQMNERVSGAAFGAMGGAAIGGLATGNAVGVLLGGLSGGVAGYIVGDYLADRRERCAPSACDPCAPPMCPPTQAAPQPTYAPCGPYVGGVRAENPRRREADAWVARGRIAPTSAEAQRAYAEALRLDPDHAEAWYRQGLQLRVAGRTAEARAAFRQALESDPSHGPAARQMAELGR